MKLWKKALSLALCLCLVLSLMPALAPVEAEAASVPTYISGIYFAADKNQSTAKNAVKNAGYTLIDYDLNKGCGASSKYIYMGYKTTSDPSQAITGIFFSDDIKNPAASYTFPYNGKQITANKVSDVDLNSGASGDYIFAYTTTDLNFGNPVTTIQIKGNNSINAAEADGTWTIGRQIASGALYGTDGRNLNAATLGDKIYLHYKQAKALEAKAYFYQMGAQDAVSTVCTSYSGTVYDNYNTIEAKPQILQEVSLGGVTYRFAGWREDTNGYVVTTTKPQMGADKVRYYYAIYDFDITVTFDADGGNGAPDSFTVTSRAGAWQGTIPPGSTLPFFPISQEGVTVTLPTTVPTKEGTCGFSRWVRICDGTTVEPGGKILMTFARYYSQMRAEYLPHEDSNRDGFCDRCDTSIDQPSVSNGAYQISTKAQLAWFMQKVNKGETSANAVLVNDIDMGGYEWTPITSTGLYYKTEGSDKGYAGTFDGAGYTISNFKITASTTEEKTYGLFGTLSGTVKNLGIRNVTYNFPNGIKDLRAAGIVGQMLPGSTVTDCFVVDSSIAPGKYIVGGVAACNYGGTIANCYTKNVTVKGDDRCGDLVSDTRGDNGETDRRGTVINCYTDASRVTGTQTGNLTSNCEAGVTADRFASGEIAYRLGQAWGQELGKDALPTPGKAQVYYGYTTCHRDQTAPIYTNQQTTAEKPGHRFNANHICTVCELVCTHTEFAGGKCLCGKITGGYCGAEGDGKNLTWTLADGLLTVSGTGAMKDFSYTEDPAPWQERCEEVTSILIEDGVTYLGIMSFPLCTNLTEVQLPDSLEGLGYSVFNKCKKLASIIIPEKVTEIPHHAFYGCNELESVTFKGKVTIIDYQAFQDCYALTYITIPDTVETIGKSAFDQCISLVHVVIPDKVTTIGPKAFQRCNALKSVTIGKGVTQIGDNAFKNCETLKTLTWLAEGDVALGVDVFSGTTNTANVDLLMTYHHADEITDLVNWNGYTFKTIRVLCADGTLNHTTDYTGNNDLSHHIACSTCGYVGDEVHAYGENGTCGICSYTCTHTTFAGGTCICGKITGGYCGAEGDGKNLTWTLVDGVLTISGEGAMKECSKSAELPWAADRAEIHSVEIGNGVTTIAKYAFAYFALLTEVQIPDSVVSISTGAFGECRKLEKINIPAKVTVIPEKAFFNCESLKSITLEGNITTIETKAFQYCDKLTEILLPSSVETIGEYVFFHCWRLSEIVIPDSVTSIGVGAFMECGTLKNVTIGKGVTQIGDGAFGYCTALETLTWLAEGDVSLGENVFEETNTANIDLLLTYHHADEITDLVNWNGYTFKSIRVLCADGTLNHTADYTANTDGTHGINCSTCGYVVNEVHAPQYAPKDNATHEMTCTLCGYAATEACSGGEGTATCINRKVCDLCQAPYGELNPNNHAAETYTNGFLDCCGKVYEPATGSGTESDPYKIGNAGQLYWFAQQVNGGNTAIHGKLVKNILINENVLAQDGTLNEGQFRAWTPMGSYGNRYTGTFDGNGKTISGLYFNNSAASDVGLFSYVGNGGIVKNVGIQDSYVSGRSYVGGVVGYNFGTVMGCDNSGIVTATGDCVGGVVGYNFGTVMGCDNSGIVTATGDCVGGVAGYNQGGTITGCHNSGSVSGRSYVGGVAGDNYNGTVMGCHNSGSVSSTGDNVGGVVGENNLGTVTGCDNSGSVSGSGSFAVGGVTGYNNNGGTVTGCRNSGSVSNGFTIGGVVGYSYDSTVTDSYNTGSVSGSTNVGGVVGYNSDSTVTDCYNSGTVSGNTYVGGVVGQLSSGTVTNCYYDSTVCSADAIGYNADGTVTDVLGKTTEQFASGEVAYLLSQGCTVGEGEDAVTYPGDIWGQNIDGEGEKDAYPVFSDAKVYQILNCNNEPAGYSNTDSDALGHDWKDADCDTPKTCTGCGTTEGDALGHDWDGNVCVRCNVAAQARIADTYFINFTDAVAAAKEGDIIQVLTDVAIDEELTFAGFVTLQVADGVRITPDKTMVKIGTDEGMIFDNKLYFYKETDELGISIADVTKPTYYKAGDGYVIYLPATDSTEAILELHNATITTRDHELNGSSNSSKAIELNGDLTLRFFGTNTIAAGQCQDTNRGISVGGNLTLEGSEDAVLYVSSGKCPTTSMGIQTNNLIITGGTVYVSARESDCQSIAVSAETVTVAEGAALYAAGGITSDLSIGVVSMNVSGNINALVLTMTIISDDEIVWDVIAMGDAQLTANTQLVYHAKDIGYEPKITFTVPENAVLTVNEGVTLNLVEPALESIDFSGTVVNNGIIILPADFRLEDAPKSGNVIIGEQSFTWNGHMWSCTGDNHSWLDATCTDPKSCKYCSATEGEALGHDWTDADCDTPKTCNRCGETEGEALGHSWNDATCTDPKTCSVCGQTEGEALGHKLVDRICTVCNKMPLRIEMTNIDATGWNGNAIRVCEDGQLIATVTLAEDKTGDIWYYLGDPNKTYEFYWVKGDYCGGCGFAITIGDETVMIAFADVNMEYADGIRIYPACEEHDYRLVKVHEPTCDLWGYTLYVCTVCGESKEDDYVPSLGHTIAEDAVGVVTPPTCENDGYTTYECDRCGESFNALYLPALPHTLGEDGLCSVCGQPYTVPVWVAGIQIDANNLTDVLGDGTVSYDPSANVLTLNGFAYEGTDVGIYTAMSVNIVLLGENTIYTEDYGILSEATDGEITIRGTGTLTINSATVGIEMYHYGQASLVIGGSVTVSAYAEDAEGIACYSEMEEACVVLQDNAKVILGTQEAPLGEECVYVKGFTCGSFTIEDNASISGITTDEEGIYVGGDQQFIVISDNASVYFCADKEALDANTIRISGGTVTAIGGEGYEGIYADELIITGGTVTVSTVEVEDRAGDGVEADCITITGGTLKILSGGLIASMDGGETNVPGTITLGEGVVIASPAGAVLGQFDLTAIGEGMVLAVLDAEGNFADSLIIQFCVHEWADADCDTPKTCILCGATEGEPLGHSYENDVCTICGHIGVPVKLDSASLSFKEKIHYNIFFSLGLDETVDLSDMGLVMFDSLKADGTMDDAIAIYAGAVEMDGKYMVATDGVPAKYMGDTIYFRVYAKLADGSYVYSKTVEYSAVTYAEHILNSDKPESAKALVVAMLNYGAAAQMYFGYNTDNLVNAFLTDEQKALPEQYRDDMANTVPVVAAEKQGIFANNKGFNKRVPAVSFEGAFEINYFFTPAYAPVDGITLYYWTEADFEANEVLTVDNATGSLKLEGTGTEQYRGDIGGIAAKNLSENIYVAAVYSDGTTTWTSGVLGYSIGAYCGRLATNGGTIADLAMATAVYGYHAKAYFG